MIYFLLLSLMGISLLIISSVTNYELLESGTALFFTYQTKRQMQYFFLGIGSFFLFSSIHYYVWKKWAPALYLMIILALMGLFFVPPIAGVHRWYSPHLGQPSEFAKAILIITLSFFFEIYENISSSWRMIVYVGILSALPFFLIARQPDLGTALTLCFIVLGILYFTNVEKRVVQWLLSITCSLFIIVLGFFLHLFPHEALRPYATIFLKNYQYDRLLPTNYHLEHALTAISLGGITGSGWKKSSFTGWGYLPEAYKDAVFAAFGEEFGLLGILFLFILFYLLIAHCFETASQAKDTFGRLLSIGVGFYLATHFFFNIGMMSGLLPITGIPLPLITFGGSSVLTTMSLLGIVQNVRNQKFMFSLPHRSYR